MKVDNLQLDKQTLICWLQSTYAINIVSLDFVPKGEESYSYIATTPAGQKYFLKIHLTSVSPALEACYRFVHQLHTTEGCNWVVCPYLTKDGKSLAALENYAVALFDYVVGSTKLPRELAGPQMGQLADALLKLHTSVTPELSIGLLKETFAISFKGWLLEVLDVVDQPLQKDHAWAQTAYNLIRSEKPHILDMMAQLQEIAIFLQNAELERSLVQVVTHGDLASYNIIQNEQGALFLFDWGKLCVAPAERDIVALWEDGNVALLSSYFDIAYCDDTAASPPSKRALTYYFYYNLIAIITDYGSWLLLEDASQEEVDHAWQVLSQVLPLDLDKVQTKVEAIYQLAIKQLAIKK